MKIVKYTESHTVSVSKIINAPSRFVYEWCTDYRESDPKISGSKAKRRILLKTNCRVIYLSLYRSERRSRSAVNVVTLYPQTAWHLDFIGDEDDEAGDYVLTRLGPHKTRLDMTFEEHYKVPKAPTKAQDLKQTNIVWDRYVSALEKEYARK